LTVQIDASKTRRSAEALAESFARALVAAGTRVVYGVPGGGNNLDVVDAAEAAGLRFVLTHAEAAAAIMAAVDGDLTPGPGACLFTRGSGAASAANGLAHALLDRSPVVAIGDAVPWGDRGRIPRQRFDQQALFGAVTKWSAAVGGEGAERVVAAAVELACAPPAGPVELDFVPDAPAVEPPAVDAPGRRRWGDPERLLAAARRPVLALGVGARAAVGPLRELLRDKPWPVLTTYRAKGVVPESWTNAAGLLTGGTVEAPVLREADLVVAIGLDAAELIPAEWPSTAPVVALGEWPVTDSYFEPDAEVVGPLAESIALVAENLTDRFDGRAFGRETRLADSAALVAAPARGIGPQHVVLAARQAAPAGTIATVDSGAHMLVTMPLWEVDDVDEALISSGLATMGFALPAAIAAAVARPGRRVVCFTGDGGLGMVLAELETLARLALPVTVVVFNDSALSLIEIKQRPEGQGGAHAVRYGASDFAAIAGAFGIAHRRIERRDDLPAAFVEALREERPFLLDVRVDPSGYRHVLAAIRGSGARA
jgi:acetolactate synthase-1/2/3 large subunit